MNGPHGWRLAAMTRIAEQLLRLSERLVAAQPAPAHELTFRFDGAEWRTPDGRTWKEVFNV